MRCVPHEHERREWETYDMSDVVPTGAARLSPAEAAVVASLTRETGGEGDEDDDEEESEGWSPSGLLSTYGCGLLSPCGGVGACTGAVASGAVARDEPVDLPGGRRRGSTYSSSHGRIVRVLVVGSSGRKVAVVAALRHGAKGAGDLHERLRHAESVKTDVYDVPTSTKSRSRSHCKHVVIFNSVPSRDLENPRVTSEFEAYLGRASCAIVAVDDNDPQWPLNASKWLALLKDSKPSIEVALLLSSGDGDAEDPRVAPDEATLAERAGDFCDATDVIGWFRHADDPAVDQSRTCMTAILDHLDRRRHYGPGDGPGWFS